MQRILDILSQYSSSLGQSKLWCLPPRENSDTRWHQRGWTFQERVVSRRCLGFQNGTVFWHCKQAKWWEEIAAEPEDIPQKECLYHETPAYDYSFKLDPWPNIYCYWRLVFSYTCPGSSLEDFIGESPPSISTWDYSGETCRHCNVVANFQVGRG
jgi:hypothetical protein